MFIDKGVLSIFQ